MGARGAEFRPNGDGARGSSDGSMGYPGAQRLPERGPGMSRRTILAITVSVALHGAAGLALWRWAAQERVRPLPGRLAVELALPAPAPEPPAEAVSPATPRKAPVAEPAPAPVAGPLPRPVTAPPAWEPRPYPRPSRRDDEAVVLRSPRRHADVASDWWSRRSAVAFVEAWREGGAPRDSALDRHVTAAERILASTNRGLNKNFLRLRRRWQEERFREKYAENFPPMGQIPAEPEP